MPPAVTVPVLRVHSVRWSRILQKAPAGFLGPPKNCPIIFLSQILYPAPADYTHYVQSCNSSNSSQCEISWLRFSIADEIVTSVKQLGGRYPPGRSI